MTDPRRPDREELARIMMADPRRPEREELARIIDPHADWDNPKPSWRNSGKQGRARMTADRVQDWVDDKSDTVKGWVDERPRLHSRADERNRLLATMDEQVIAARETSRRTSRALYPYK